MSPAIDASEDAAPSSGSEGLPASPYKGLTAYGAQDAAFFFGRDDEREMIAANLVAARLTVIYGASGVGKSSLLHAGVARDLRELAKRNLARRGRPELAVVAFAGWHDPDVVSALRRALHEAVADLGGSFEPAGSLADDLAAAAEAVGGEVLLIFDQFEEYFLYHPRDVGEGGFDAEFARAVTRPDLQANFLIALREDAITRLDRFKGRVPYLFDNYLRVRHLDRSAARSAIVEPIEQLKRAGAAHGEGIAIEPELVERVLDDVRAGHVVLADSGHGGVRARDGDVPDEARIETPYLQLVMTRLWEEEAAAGSRVLRLATFERLGGAQQIVRANLDDSLARLSPSRRDVVARIFLQLVTPSGTKVAHAPADLAEYAEVPESEMLELLEELSQGSVRVLRAVADESGNAGGVRYEIFHDVLAAPILEWRRRHVAEAQRAEHEAKQREADRMRVEAEQEARRERRRARIFRALAIAAGAFAIGVAVLAVLAVRAKQKADSQELAGRATALLSIDPAQSVRRASEALDARATPAAEVALRTALEESLLRAGLTGHEGALNTAVFSADGATVATASDDRTARLWDADTGDQRGAPLGGHKKRVMTVMLDGEGRRVVTAGLDGTVRIWDARTRRVAVLRPGAGPLYRAMVAFGPDGRHLVTAGSEGNALIYDAATGRLRHTLAGHGGISAVAISADGSRVATTGSDKRVRIWDTATGKLRSTFPTARPPADATYATSLEFDTGGTQLLLGTADKAFVTRLSRSPVPVPRPLRTTYRFGLMAAHFSPDGRTVVTVGDKTADLWSSSTARRIRRLQSPTYVINARFSPDNQQIVSAGQDGTARVWTRGGELIAELRGHRDAVLDARFSRDNDTIVTSSTDATARIWSLSGETVLEARDGEAMHTVIARGGRHVLSASLDGRLRLWDASTNRVSTLNGQGARLSTAALGASGEVIVTVSEPGTAGRAALTVFEAGRRAKPVPLPGTVYGLALSRDERRVFTGGAHNDSRPKPVFAAIRDLRGRVLQELRVDDMQRLTPAERRITSADFSPGDDRVAMSSGDKLVRMFRVSDGKLLRTIPTSAAAGASLWSVRWSDSGRRIVTAGNDGVVRIWNAGDGKAVRVLEGFRGPANHAIFANDDRWIIGGGSDGSTRVWDLASGRPLAVMHRHSREVNDLAFRDRTILSADERTVRAYGCQTCGSLAEVRALAEDRERHVGGLYGE